MSSAHSDEQTLLEFITEQLFFTQIIDQSTHRAGNILDLVFCSHPDDWDFVIKESSCSDHNFIFLIFEGIRLNYCSSSAFSLSSFDAKSFIQNLPITKSLAYDFHNSHPAFISRCYKLLERALQLSVNMKRKKRIDAPFFLFFGNDALFKQIALCEKR